MPALRTPTATSWRIPNHTTVPPLPDSMRWTEARRICLTQVRTLPRGSAGLSENAEQTNVPELPEVESVRFGLQEHVSGRRFADIRVLHPRAARRHLAGPAEFAAALTGGQVGQAKRRGKYLWLTVGEDALLAHLGMSGQLLVGDPPSAKVNLARRCGSPSPTAVPT